MAQQTLLEQHQETLEGQAHSRRFGMWLLIASEILFFGALFALYTSYRLHYESEFAEATKQSKVVIGTVNTYLLLTASWFAALAIGFTKRSQPARATLSLGATLVLGAGFLAAKGYEYSLHIHEGALPGAAYHWLEVPGQGGRVYFDLYYVMTGLHAIHVIIGLGVVGVLAVRSWRG
ncbi:MAG TPA: cytochrome c oxidase subunit 3 family protein, partial [Planctomycetota bacterium]|nr:cytochrome c oxidase subunit 3 family protein [Planctomycetota bacterium]